MGVLALKFTLIFLPLYLKIPAVFRPRTTPGNPGAVTSHRVDDRSCARYNRAMGRKSGQDFLGWAAGEKLLGICVILSDR